ncbi:glycosyltransferase family 2 protein [Dethiosulfovibrio salsuginis]|uniref:Glycosyl transferase family 2 n=1 Tax=Dethiosulfovibrio salsuginis TaxID=561720 RepID=A0A1X7INM6_9BACT|nr:glycosyltransferase family 2 protein [Dethiosulfovibrio salsuginis]SMG16544.1 Glycosyl transferase family 2 [Dethiosulfovibrio salsuginis]
MISIIIPTHNSERFLLNTIKSLQMQTDQNFEIVFVDDNSNDSTLHLIKEFKLKNKEKVQILASPQNIGPGGARNLGIKSAKGEFILFLDSDDTLTSNAIEKLNKIIATKPIDCLFFDALSVKNKKKHTSKLFPLKMKLSSPRR